MYGAGNSGTGTPGNGHKGIDVDALRKVVRPGDGSLDKDREA